MRRRYWIWGSILLGLISLPVAGYQLLLGNLASQEQISPSTARVLVLGNGQRIPLVPLSPAPRRAGALITPALLGAGESGTSVASPSPPPEQLPLPPVRVQIPQIDLDWPVVLSENDHLPRFRAVGWMLGTAYPAHPGNMVLFGHLDGKYATFARLRELQPGADIQVVTDGGTQHYQVRAIYDTAPDDVAVLAPPWSRPRR
jgi:LPXTG-site transpeptidase (sortase) family protein